MLLMFVGACAGSTGGGMKVSRLVILLKTVKKELSQFLHPGRVAKIRMDGKVVEHETIRSINVFMVAYLLIFSLSVLALSFDGTDLITNFTAVAATFNNIGPGLEQAGPATNFAMFSNVSKLVMTFDMLAGRLKSFRFCCCLCGIPGENFNRFLYIRRIPSKKRGILRFLS